MKNPVLNAILPLILLIVGSSISSIALADDSQWVVSPESSSAIQKMLSFSDRPDLEISDVAISIQKDRISAELGLKNNTEKITIQLTHASTCEHPFSKNFCLSDLQAPEGIVSDRKIQILDWIKSRDKVDVWKSVQNEENEAEFQKTGNPAWEAPAVENTPQEKIPENSISSSQLALRSLLLMVAIASMILFCLFTSWYLIRWLIIKPSGVFPLLFWFAYALFIRLILCPAVPVNHYGSVPPVDWIANFPSRGLIFPLFENALFSILPASLETVTAAVAVIGAASVVLAFVFVKNLTGNLLISHLSALLLSIVPFHARLSSTDSAHALLLFFLLAAFVAWQRAIDKKSLGLFLLTAISATIVILTRPEAVHFPFLILLFTHDWRKVPRAWWLIAIPIGIIALLNMIAMLESQALESVVGREPPNILSFYRWPYDLLLSPLGGGEWPTGEAVLMRQYFSDMFFGVFPDLFSGAPQWRFHRLIQWLPAILVPVMWLGMWRTIREKKWRVLLIAIVLTRFVGWLTTRDIGVDEFLEARYFIPAYLFDVVLIAIGFEWLLSHRWSSKLKKRLVPIVFAAIAIIAISSSVRAYGLKYTYQDEYHVVRKLMQHVPEGSTIFTINSGSSGVSNIEISLRPGDSLLAAERPDINWRILSEKAGEINCKENCFYLEMAECQITPDRYIPLKMDDNHTPQWKERMKLLAEFQTGCREIKANLKRIDRQYVQMQSFAWDYMHKGGVVPVSLYAMHD